MGGQGGGVLVDWIVALVEGQGWLAQSTSVPGVAQRTGATIYYIEAIESDGSGRRPVLSLMPVPGEVDIVIGAELMEAGRAMQRGLVTPDRTTLIASSHRSYAVSEKIAPGDGIGDPAKVHEAARAAQQAVPRLRHGGHRRADRQRDLGGVVRRAGGLRRPAVPARRLRGDDPRSGRRRRGEPACLRPRLRRGRGGARSRRRPRHRATPAGKSFPTLQPIGDAGFDALVERARKLPEPVHGMVAAGLARVVDFQDVAYGREYLDRVECLRRDRRRTRSTSAAAK